MPSPPPTDGGARTNNPDNIAGKAVKKPVGPAMPHGDILGFAPPLVMTHADADEIVVRTLAAVDEVTEELRREKH